MNPLTEKRPTALCQQIAAIGREELAAKGPIQHYYECVEMKGQTLTESADAPLGRGKLPTGRNATAEAVRDLRNILGTISMLSDLGILDLPRSSAASSTFQQIKLACADAKDLCERKLENQVASSNVQQVDLATLVMAMVPLLTTYFRADSSLRVNGLNSAPVANDAAAKIRQVVTNLVKNAAEALGGQPGMVTISTGVMELDGRTYSYLDVYDTGCGMDDETSSQLFEHSFTTKFDGHGLGHEYRYRLVIGDKHWMRIDPYARQVTNSVGNAIVHDPTFDWQGDNFQMPPVNEIVIYELHLGTFHDQPKGQTDKLTAAVQKLDHLHRLGVNVIEVMPLAEFAGYSSWGYNPACVFAVESDYGGPVALSGSSRQCIKAAWVWFSTSFTTTSVPVTWICGNLTAGVKTGWAVSTSITTGALRLLGARRAPISAVKKFDNLFATTR